MCRSGTVVITQKNGGRQKQTQYEVKWDCLARLKNIQKCASFFSCLFSRSFTLSLFSQEATSIELTLFENFLLVFMMIRSDGRLDRTHRETQCCLLRTVHGERLPDGYIFPSKSSPVLSRRPVRGESKANWFGQ